MSIKFSLFRGNLPLVWCMHCWLGWVTCMLLTYLWLLKIWYLSIILDSVIRIFGIGFYRTFYLALWRKPSRPNIHCNTKLVDVKKIEDWNTLDVLVWTLVDGMEEIPFTSLFKITCKLLELRTRLVKLKIYIFIGSRFTRCLHFFSNSQIVPLRKQFKF